MLLRWIGIILTFVVVNFFDLRQALIDRWQVHVRRMYQRVLRETRGERAEATPGRLAVVALYPSDDSLPFTLNLLDALGMADFWILVVSTRRLNDEQLAQIRARSHHIVERGSVGRDFGSYKMAIERLEQQQRLQSAEVLVLANDSMFYPKAFAAEIQRMLQRPGDWQPLFENYEHHYHAQSFFLLFRAEVLRSKAFLDFWARYKPYSARVHAINRGEVKLTSSLKRAGFVCDPAYSSLRLATALAERPLPLEEVSALVPSGEHWPLSKSKMLSRMIEVESSFLSAAPLPQVRQESSSSGSIVAFARVADGGRSFAVPPARRANIEPQQTLPVNSRPFRIQQLLWRLWLFDLAQLFESHNPTHFGALLCNHLFAAPIKRDVCYRGTLAIHQLVRAAAGFDARELASMERDLRDRGLGWQARGTRRLLFDKGRV